MKVNYKNRLNNTKSIMQAQYPDSILVVSSANRAVRSRDTHFQFRQNSDFYYLTGSNISYAMLLVSPKLKRPLLVVKKQDPVTLIWEGKPENCSALAKGLGCELLVSTDPIKDALLRIKGHCQLIYQNIPGCLSWALTKKVIDLPSSDRGCMPGEFVHSDAILEQQRLYKDRSEVELIMHANAITNEALSFVASKIQPGMYEFEVARTLEYVFGMNDAAIAFETIVASGVSAATLHYVNLRKALKAGEMLLIDSGAEFGLYSADITRVMPVSGRFLPWQRDLYEIVLESQKAALSKVRHGVKIAIVYEAAARKLTQGLVDMKVLKGSLGTLMEKKAYRPYFPHGIGHSLGLDTHDLSQLRGNNSAILEEGMVFTVEPGLYFPKAVGKVLPCGIRIEDNVLVTKKGCQILSAGFPKETTDIESILS